MNEAKGSLLTAYLAAKEDFRDAVVLYQVGGFYQAFYNDALLLNRELGVRLLSRAMGGGERAPMCGVPASSAREHAQKLADRGFRVALYSQFREENGGCRRELTAVVSPEGQAQDLAAAWDAYFRAPPEVPAPKPRTKRGGESAGLQEQLMELNLSQTTPMRALEILQDWQERCARGEFSRQ